MTWIIKRNGLRTRVIPGQRPGGCDPDEFYESDLTEARIEHIQSADWYDQAELLETYMDPQFAQLVTFVCKHWPRFSCNVGTEEQRERLNETFVGLAETAAERLDALIAEHCRSPHGRAEMRAPYDPVDYGDDP